MRFLNENMIIRRGGLYAHPMIKFGKFSGGNKSRPYTTSGKEMRNYL